MKVHALGLLVEVLDGEIDHFRVLVMEQKAPSLIPSLVNRVLWNYKPLRMPDNVDEVVVKRQEDMLQGPLETPVTYCDVDSR